MAVAGVTIRQAAVKSGYSEVYIRRLVLEGRLPAEKVDGVWYITNEALEAKQSQTRNTHATATFIIHVPVGGIPDVRAALEALGIGLEPRYRHNQEKRAAYNKKRNAAKKAHAHDEVVA